MPDLTDKVALVTGGASGLGKAIAERLRADGARVVITDVQEGLGLEVARASGFTFLPQDVTDAERWASLLAEVRAELGGVHILVNNAGVLGAPGSDLGNARLEDWKRIFSVNVEGVFLGCQAGVAAIAESGGGSIVNISSIAALIATPFTVAYGASKAAVRHLTKSVAQYSLERQLGVRCNSVHPGIVRTPAWDAGLEDRAAARGISVEATIAEGRRAIPADDFTLPEDVAGGVAFLVSDDARHVTGEQLIIDGGLVHADTFFNSALTGRR